MGFKSLFERNHKKIARVTVGVYWGGRIFLARREHWSPSKEILDPQLPLISAWPLQYLFRISVYELWTRNYIIVLKMDT